MKNWISKTMKTSNGISCVDLFCGAGGLTRGLVETGIPVTTGIDLDPACRFPYESNCLSTFLQADVSSLEARSLSALFVPETIRVLAGCAPCQPFSTYSQRYAGNRDKKWVLIDEFRRLAEQVLPDIVTMENVPSAQRHSVFKNFVSTLERHGYRVTSRVVDCAHYGVPQSRKRVVVLASQFGAIEMIEPTHTKPKTVRQAIGRLRPISAGETAPRDRLHTSSRLSEKNLDRIRASVPGGTWRDWPKALVANCHKRDTGRTYPGVYGRMKWDEPAPTMTTQCYGYGNGRFGHPEQDRAISLREAAILQGFPRDYEFVERGQKVEFNPIGRMIGNAVPVQLGQAIAKSILQHLDLVGAPAGGKRRSKRANAA